MGYIHTCEAQGHVAPEGECVYNPHTPKRCGIADIYAS